MATYYSSADAMLRNWNQAVGWCLQFGIAFHVKGEFRSTGEMNDDIYVHRARYGLDQDGQPIGYRDARAQMEELRRITWLSEHQVTYCAHGPLQDFPWGDFASTMLSPRQEAAYQERLAKEMDHFRTHPVSDYYDLGSKITREAVR